ncbi:cytochrome C [Azospirillum sp. B21]|uniref:cytochrome C n=1 Tax=Azospirillum sp. B21 TaxID=2607496 RepID=UPI0011EFDC73|nr:cytochrome C [Azospirillum sp. B21]KAA0571058.1 cytochrome C [Azospirillum sp. B21]
MRFSIAATAALLLTGNATLASEFERVPPVTHAATLKECGECHMAYQPGLLPAAGWTRIMDGLADHFGDKASLPPDVAADIRGYLTRNAGGGDGQLVRITDQRWWLRKHRFDPTVWQRRTVGAKGNCEACHRTAAKGLYEDD